MNYTANIQNFLKKNEMHCIFLSKIHKICSALLFQFLYWKEVQEGLTSLSDNNHILSCLKIGNNLDDAFRYVARHIREVLAGADGLEKGEKLIAQALTVQLIEITLVVLRILVSYLKVIGFPPRSRHIDIALGA